MYTPSEVEKILHCASKISNPNAPIKYLCTDSRRISFAGESLFIALKTNNRNAENFINNVYQQGVRNFLVNKNFDFSSFNDANFFLVENTLDALQKLAAYHRKKFHFPVVAITGSNGKTIVKEWLYQLLSEDFNIVRSPRSYNSQIGVPLSVWEMNDKNNLAIFEAGISQKNEMQKLQEIIQPTIGILTNIGEAHSKNFENKEEKLIEKIKLFSNSEIVFTFFDDELIKKNLPKYFSGNIFSIGKEKFNTLQIIQTKTAETFTNISFQHNEKIFQIKIPFTDSASLHNILLCIAVMLYLKIDIDLLQEHILHLQPVEMRMQVLPGINGCIFINDSYSLDIQSLEIALDFLSMQPNDKSVIVSDFPQASAELYHKVIEMLQSRNIKHFITIGKEWEAFSNELKQLFSSYENYANTSSFITHFNSQTFRNEAILIKGARKFSFEKIIPLFQQKIHSTFLEVNLNAIIHNVKEYRKFLKPETKLMAMVKAFGYGSGSLEIASLLQYHQVDYLTVAYTDEAVELKEAGIQLPIMIMNIDESAFEKIITYNLQPEIFSFNILKRFIHFLEKEGLQQYPIHIKIDTGMHRLGFEEKDISPLVELLNNHPQVLVKSAFSHFVASEDEAENDFTQHQSTLFLRCITQLEKGIGYSFIRHISNSAGIVQHPEMQLDMVRLGIGLYGIDTANSSKIDLIPAISFKTTIAQIRTVKANDSVGYNRKGKIIRDSKIATIRVGYADGFRRSLGHGKGAVYINGKIAPVVGIVCMDMAMVDITEIENVSENDIVEIFGVHLPLEKVAKWCDTNTYEILTGIGQRVKRVYTEE